MSSNPIVVDSSVVLAVLKRESIKRLTPAGVVQATISTLNLSEVLARLYESGTPEPIAIAAIDKLQLDVVSFDADQARVAARLLRQTKHLGLSLADRACIGLGITRNLPIFTADRIWSKISIKTDITIVR